MNIKNKPLRVLGMIGGVLFSIVLIITLIASLLFSVAASITKPNTIVTLIKDFSLTEQIMDDPSITDAIEQEGIPAELVADLLDSPFFKDTVEAYTEDIIASVQGKQPDVIFNEQTVKQFAEEHMDSLVALVEKHMPEGTQATEAEIESALRNMADSYATSLVQAIPTGEQLKEMLVETELQKPVEFLVSSTVPTVLYTVIGVLAVLIFVCLLHKFRGLLCLGIDALVAALPLFALYLALSGESVTSSLLGDSTTLVATLVSVLVGKLGVYLIVLSVVGVLFIAGFITYHILAKKKACAVQLPVASDVSNTESVETVPVEEG